MTKEEISIKGEAACDELSNLYAELEEALADYCLAEHPSLEEPERRWKEIKTKARYIRKLATTKPEDADND